MFFFAKYCSRSHKRRNKSDDKLGKRDAEIQQDWQKSDFKVVREVKKNINKYFISKKFFLQSYIFRQNTDNYILHLKFLFKMTDLISAAKVKPDLPD